MKKKFSPKWKGSRQKRKKNKYLANAPLHFRHKMLSCNLNKELRKKYGRRNFPLRKGDSVKVMAGKFFRKSGKIADVDLKKMRVAVEGIQIQKKDGTKINIYFEPSNLQITEMDLNDKKREDKLKKIKKEEREKGEKNALEKK